MQDKDLQARLKNVLDSAGWGFRLFKSSQERSRKRTKRFKIFLFSIKFAYSQRTDDQCTLIGRSPMPPNLWDRCVWCHTWRRRWRRARKWLWVQSQLHGQWRFQNWPTGGERESCLNWMKGEECSTSVSSAQIHLRNLTNATHPDQIMKWGVRCVR